MLAIALEATLRREAEVILKEGRTAKQQVQEHQVQEFDVPSKQGFSELKTKNSPTFSFNQFESGFQSLTAKRYVISQAISVVASLPPLF